MRPGRQAGRARRVISLTPLIDVVFILLVFFMLASSFLDWRSVELNLPAQARAAAPNDALLVVTLTQPDDLALNGEALGEQAFDRRLMAAFAEDAERPVVLRAGEAVPLQRAIDILERIKAAGGLEISLVRHGGEAS